MGGLEIRNTGVAGLVIKAGSRRILVDAFNTLNQPEPVYPGDIILITHDDGDHFSPQQLPELKKMDIIILGPPTIVKPILELKKADLEQIHVLYSKDPFKPADISLEDIHIQAIHTQHFNHWDALNNSYLIEALGQSLYITGDSLVTKELFTAMKKPNIIICNLVDEGYLKCQEDLRFAVHHLMSYLLRISSECEPEKIIGIHLLNFERTIDAVELKKLVDTNGFTHIIIPTDCDQIIQI